MTVSDIIAQFGGTSELARLLNVPVSTVDSWRANNRIPRWRQPAILDLAHRLEKSVSTADFPARAA
jgi:DNA-binding transcriptional regulator YiaG